MGFLDSLKKTASSLKDQVEQSGVVDKLKEAASGAGQSSSGTWVPPAPLTENPAHTQVAEGGDLSDALRWIGYEDVAAITGFGVAPGQAVQDDQTWGLAFVSSDGTRRVEVRSVDEDVIGSVGGDPRQWIGARTASEPGRVVEGFGDYAYATTNADVSTCYAWVADACFTASIAGAGGDTTAECERLLRHVFAWPG
ncbi:MAG: hypothetical protein U0V73_14030 [Acidimicrobiia bacterium]